MVGLGLLGVAGYYAILTGVLGLSVTDPAQSRIIVNALNEPGALGVISTVIGDAGANIDHIEFVSRSPDFRDIVIDLEVLDLSHLNAIIAQLKAKSVVSKVERVNG